MGLAFGLGGDPDHSEVGVYAYGYYYFVES
jgi:hypothetical protein